MKLSSEIKISWTELYENTTYSYLWDTAKAVVRGKFIALKWVHKKEEKFQISDLSSHLQYLEKEEKIHANEKKENMSNIDRTEINETENEQKTNKEN